MSYSLVSPVGNRLTAAGRAIGAEARVYIFKSAVRWIMDARWEGGVGPRSTLLAVDEQHGFDGLGRLMIPEATGVTEALND